MCLQYSLGACWSAVSIGSRLFIWLDTMIWLMFEIHFLSYSIMFICSLFTHNVSFQFWLCIISIWWLSPQPSSKRQEEKVQSKQTSKQTKKQELINWDQETRIDLHIIASELQEEYTKEQINNMRSPLRFVSHREQMTRQHTQIKQWSRSCRKHFCVPWKWKINKTKMSRGSNNRDFNSITYAIIRFYSK